MSAERKLKFDLLLQYYESFLTDNQRQVLREYYFFDISLSEIGKNLSITRQSVYDTLKNGETILLSCEDKLNLIAKDTILKSNLISALDFINRNESEQAKKVLTQILNNLEE